ncbi:MAG TPA: DUF3995 domain-containing protein [Thermoplasmata archaeon]|nr:DUF3995 domain-containing protein [Thermoplasmata archaeon]
MVDEPAAPSPRELRFAAGAAIWSFAFASISFYWAAGGTFGVNTVGNQIESYATTLPGFFVILWIDAVVKTLLGALAVVLATPSWRKTAPGKGSLPTVAWTAGFLMLGYGAVEFTVTGFSALLMATRVLTPSPSVDWTGIAGHLALWDPYWMLGGVLFLHSARGVGARPREVFRRWIRTVSHST